MSLVRHEVQQVANAAALAALTIVPTNNDEVHVEGLNRRFNWLEGSSSVADNQYIIKQTSESANGRWAATAVEGAKVFTGSGASGAIPNGNTAVFTVALTGSGTLLANSGAALGITNGGSFPTNVFLDSIVLVADNTAQLTIVNESGNDVSSFNVDVKAIDYTSVAAAAAAATPKQVAYGSVENTSTSSSQSHNVTFPTQFAAPPYVFVTSRIVFGIASITVTNVTEYGFSLTYNAVSNGGENQGFIDWKAEEK